MPPSSARRLIERPRLAALAANVGRTKLTLVRAPAGFGKTSLLAQWYGALAAEGRRVGWLSFDAGDRDAHAVLAYIAAALESAGHELSETTRALVSSDGFATVDAIAAAIVNDLCAAAEPTFLFLDDLHELRVVAVVQMLGALIERLPDSLHLAIASRESAPFPIARARAFGNVVEVATAELRFSSSETAEFMAVAAGGALDATGLAVLEGRVEGWIAGLKLAAIALANDARPAELLERISGRRWTYADFFAEVVLSQLAPELVDFLLATSLLDRFCPALCDAVTGSAGARGQLDEIEARGLFIFSLDGERRWYRYHQLFAEFLRAEFARRNPAGATEVHARAARWYRASAMHVEAFAHAIAATDVALAANILNERCHSMFYDGQMRVVLECAAQIPADILRRFPRIRLAQAWSLVLQWQFPQARAILAAVGRDLERARGDDPAPREVLLHLHCTMMLAQFEDDMPTVERQCATLLERFMDADAYLVGNYFTSLLYAEREQFKLRNVERLDARARAYYQLSGSRFVLVWHQSIAGPTRFLAGDSLAAIEALQDGLEAANAIGGRGSSLSSIPALLLAEIYYERNELGEAEDLLRRHLPVASELGFVDQLVAGYVTQSRLQRLRGNTLAGNRTLGLGMQLAHARGFRRLTNTIAAEYVTQAFRAGEFERVSRLGTAYDLRVQAETLLPRTGTTTASEARAVAWVALAQAEGRLVEALQVAKAWLRFTDGAGAMRAAIRWGTIVAELLLSTGDRRGAERTLLRAMQSAVHGRFVRTFLDLGPRLPALCGDCFVSCAEPLAPVERFGRELIALSSRPGASPPAEPAQPDRPLGFRERLNVRELEIVKLVASGMSNRGIAQRLAMTEGTVKWHLHRVFDKFGARNRIQAVERARASGFIDT